MGIIIDICVRYEFEYDYDSFEDRKTNENIETFTMQVVNI